MRFLAFLFSMMIVLQVTAAPPTANTNAVLTAAHYDLAEVVFRQYMSADSKCIFALSYGTNDSSLPADFMARFKGKHPLVMSSPDNIMVVSNKFVIDKITRKEAVGLGIRELRVTGDTAEAHVIYFASHTQNSTVFHMTRDAGKWRVKDRKAEWVADGF
jgi:hypothetical protein